MIKKALQQNYLLEELFYKKGITENWYHEIYEVRQYLWSIYEKEKEHKKINI